MCIPYTRPIFMTIFRISGCNVILCEVIVMNTFLKEIFLVIGIMALSMLLFALMFNDAGHRFIWNALEPVFQSHWRMYSLNNGSITGDQLDVIFNNTVEVTE